MGYYDSKQRKIESDEIDEEKGSRGMRRRLTGVRHPLCGLSPQTAPVKSHFGSLH